MMNCKIFTKIIYLLVSLSLFACSKPDIVDKDKLENIIFEMHLADGVMDVLINYDYADYSSYSKVLYKDIFDKYGCSRNKFERSIRAYAQENDVIDTIYQHVKNRLEKIKSDLEKTNFDLNPILNKLKAPVDSAIFTVKDYFKDAENIGDVAKKMLDWYSEIPQKIKADSISKARELLKKQSDSLPKPDSVKLRKVGSGVNTDF